MNIHNKARIEYSNISRVVVLHSILLIVVIKWFCKPSNVAICEVDNFREVC